MCGLYDPTEGEILLNGVNVREYNRDEYFGLFSAVFQDISLLAVSVEENITGQTEDKCDREKLIDCMKKSGIYDKTMTLPEQEKHCLFVRFIRIQLTFRAAKSRSLHLQRLCIKVLQYFFLTNLRRRLTLLRNSRCI